MMSEERNWFEIRVWIKEGKNLENRKLLGNNAPFVEVTIGNEIKKTSSKSSLDNIMWDEKLIFRFNKIEELVDNVIIKVKDENTLLPNPLLGEYNFKLDKNYLTNNYKQEPNYVIQDGFINLENCNSGQLNVQILFKYCNEFEPQLQPEKKEQQQYEELNKEENLKSNRLMEVEEKELLEENRLKMEKMELKETHVLPTIHVKDKPTIIEKEVEINKPIEIKETILHKEKPIIVEQPIIKEKFEQYHEQPKIEQKEEQIFKESIHEEDVGNLDQQALENLREQRKQEFMDTTPNVQYEKQNVQLNTEYHEQPTQVKEKEVVYQQPIEIEKTNIEQVKPKVHEDVKVEKEHIYQKVAPEYQQTDVKYVKENEQVKENRQELSQ